MAPPQPSSEGPFLHLSLQCSNSQSAHWNTTRNAMWQCHVSWVSCEGSVRSKSVEELQQGPTRVCKTLAPSNCHCLEFERECPYDVLIPA